jgi:formylglycine-generating enzyme required for sulfatase activity
MRKTFRAMLGIAVYLALASCRDRREPLIQAGEELVNTIGMKFRLIQPGSFTMGSDRGLGNETPVHKVTLTKGFYIGVYEVTQEQWQKVMGSNPSNFKKRRNPVNNVSWDDAQEFARRLSRKENATYRLPTEAEWEYACRAGTTTEYYWGDKFDGRCAWNKRNSGGKAHPVGLTRPNAWGLCDMSGNVGEWCEDWQMFGYVSDRERVDPAGDIVGRGRVVRGGDWHWEPNNCRSAFRSWESPSGSGANVGFRLVRTIE